MNRDCSDIFITGIGLVTPLGTTRESTWARLMRNETGIKANPFSSQSPHLAQVLDFSTNGARSRMGDFALMATQDALHQAGIDADMAHHVAIGCAVSQSKPVLKFDDEQVLLSSFFSLSPESLIRRYFGLTGPSLNVVAACATGVASIATAAGWIRSNVCDIALAGASESSLTADYLTGFQQLGVLADPSVDGGWPRPFDKNRSGFVMGEGAAVMVLESARSVQSRRCVPLARLAGVALRQSRTDALRFDDDGRAVSGLIAAVLKGKKEPGYINAHGTATKINDAVETQGIKLAFGNKAYGIAVSSTKAATGHMLGAAGAVEAALSVLALKEQMLPPTLNLSTPDADCDLDYVPHSARRQKVHSSLSLSYGFGGQMGAVLFESC